MEPDKPEAKDAKTPAPKNRIAQPAEDEELDEELLDEPEKKKGKK